MAAKPSTDNAALPIGVTEGRTQGRTQLFGLADAKAAIGLPPDDSQDDAELLLKIDQAQAILERMTGLSLSPRTITAEYCLEAANAVLCVPRSDLQSVSAVVEYDAEGSTSTLASSNYELVNILRQTYVRRTDGKKFQPIVDGLSVSVTFVRGVKAGDTDSRLVEAAMGHIVAELDKGSAMTSDSSMYRNPTFMRIIGIMRGHNTLAKPIE